MPAGWPLRPGCLSQISSGTCGWLDVQRPRLQQLEAGVVERPFDLDRHAEDILGLAHQPPERRRLPGFEARRARPESSGTACGAVPAPCTQVSR